MFWIFYVFITLGLIYYLVKIWSLSGSILIVLIGIIFIMSIFILVGGIFTTQYLFNGENKTCPISATQYTLFCYNLNDAQLAFSRISTVFGWIYSFIVIFGLGAFIFQANLH